jgi:hypothetical protein
MSRSIQPTASNTSSTAITTIPSTTGYAAGELIYYNNNVADYGVIPDSAASSAPFPINTQQGPANGASGGAASITATGFGGSRTRQPTALLSNGNIVQVGINTANGYPEFRIVDSSDVQVVGITAISISFVNTSYSTISVCALSGGGFAVAWINTAGGSTNYPTYAVYSNAGVVVTSAFQDTGTGAAAQMNIASIQIYALPSGGFIASYYDTAYNLYARTYNSTGTATYAWLTVATAITTGGQYGFDIAVRSDNTYVIVWINNSRIGSYNVISALNVGITGTQTFTSTIGATAYGYGISAACLSNDTVIIGYRSFTAASTYLYAFRPLPTGNVLGTEVAVPTDGLRTSTNVGSVTVRAFNSGANFIFLWGDTTLNYKYSIYNLSSTLLTSQAPSSIYASLVYTYTGISVLDFGGNLNIYYSSAPYTPIQLTPNSYGRIDKTSYQIVSFGTTTSKQLGTASAAASGYARSGSTPNKASFFAATTGGAYGTGTVSTSINNLTVIEATAVQSMHCATYPDGRFAVAYVSNTSPYTGKVAVYSQAGVLQTTITLPVAGYTSDTFGTIRVTVTTANKLVVGFYTTSSTLVTYIYSTAYSLLYTATAISSPQISSYTGTFGLASLTNDRYVLVYSTSNQINYAVYSNTATLLAGPTVVGASTTWYNISCASSKNGFVLGGYYTGASSWYYYYVAETSTANTFASATSPITGGPSNSNLGSTLATSPNNLIAYPTGGGSTTSYYTMADGSFQNLGNGATITTTSNSDQYWMFANAWTPAGTYCIVVMDGQATTRTRLFTTTPWCWGTSTVASWPSGTVVNVSASIAATNTSQSSPCPNLAPLYGHTLLISFKNANNFPCFGFIDAYPWNYSVALTAGVTPSNSAFVVAPSNGYIFQGVSVTSASAAGVGQVVINGPAQLNSNYSASTTLQAFDFQSPNGTALEGPKGTIAGRTVNLKGSA